MTLTACLLILGSALFHTSWNLLLKQTNQKQIASWWALLIGSVCSLPLLAVDRTFVREAWPLAGLSAFFEAVYFISLAAAYGNSDFSLAYPLARGAAPALIALWSVLFLGERLSLRGGLGLVVLVVGLVTIGASALLKAGKTAPDWRSLLLALRVALFISLYSVIDGRAVRLTGSLAYTVVVFWLTTLFIMPFMLRRFGWQAIKSEWMTNRVKLSTIGLFSLLAYGLVLVAFTIAPVSYTGAIREISIVFATLAGWLFLKEGLDRMRLAGAIVAFTGILLLATAK
ncbi:MAG: EamA family transporter [Blastocatellia bacterium]|nr:EamA family transporter [Blastocatellia bacterium]